MATSVVTVPCQTLRALVTGGISATVIDPGRTVANPAPLTCPSSSLIPYTTNLPATMVRASCSWPRMMLTSASLAANAEPGRASTSAVGPRSTTRPCSMTTM